MAKAKSSRPGLKLGKRIGAAIGLIASLAAIAQVVREFFFEAPSETEKLEFSECVDVHYLTPNIFPHYLLPSIGGSDNFPYWLKVVGQNKCDQSWFLEVRFERADNIVMTPLTDPMPIPPKDGFEKVFSPEIDPASSEVKPVRIYWSIEDDLGTKLYRDSIRTAIIPPHEIAWDLKKPGVQGEREPVDPNYLMASLAAWTKRPSRSVVTRAVDCRRGAGGSKLVREEALRSCYKLLFRGEGRIGVYNEPIRFPDGDRQKIRPLHRILLEGKRASSLEAGLLFGAVIDAERVSGVDPDVVLLVAPDEDNGPRDRKTVFVAWNAGGSWKAVDMKRAGSLDFDENAAAASAKVDPVFRFSSELRNALSDGGAGFSSDGTIAAMDFHAAAAGKHGIEPMPKIDN